MIGKENKFIKGQSVICIINSRASLTVGKEYTIEYIDDYDDGIFDLSIINDLGEMLSYSSIRFIDKNEFRQYTINQITK